MIPDRIGFCRSHVTVCSIISIKSIVTFTNSTFPLNSLPGPCHRVIIQMVIFTAAVVRQQIKYMLRTNSPTRCFRREYTAIFLYSFQCDILRIDFERNRPFGVPKILVEHFVSLSAARQRHRHGFSNSRKIDML